MAKIAYQYEIGHALLKAEPGEWVPNWVLLAASRLDPSRLSRVLHGLENDGWVEWEQNGRGVAGRSSRQWRLTPEGRERLGRHIELADSART